MIPIYFDLIISGSYDLLIEHSCKLLSQFIYNSSKFVRSLGQTSIELISFVRNARLPLLSSNIVKSDLIEEKDEETLEIIQLIPSLAGGFPYLSYIKNARYNSRDAVWWWLCSISIYTKLVPNGYNILNDKVSRLYPNDYKRGFGYNLDSCMKDEGFIIEISIDQKTGFVYGGNRWNCGTWMDKMGSSEKAMNKGHPATPRDGSAIELVALCRTTISWIIQMNKQNYFPYDSIKISSDSSGKTKLFFTDWLNRIDENFEKEFWIDQSNLSEYVNRKQIYKDTINSTLKWTDFQLRPNFIIASVIAPEMFNKTHIWLALKQVETILLGKYGIKTLDPSDYNYVGDYNYDDDSYDYKCAHGFNYHNGPEWLWLTGYYIRAKLYWSKKNKIIQIYMIIQ
ncbi:unnamed protein product [Rotaria sp. Silwood2]|nr:unnamed protein product [Rotaria sp. Silwood2]